MRARLLSLTLILLSRPVFATTLDDVHAPPAGQFVTDLTGSLRPTTLAQLNALAAEVKASGRGQLGVAVVDSTSGMRPRAFATSVFNRWGVGDRHRNDGLLILAALQDRKVEVVRGDGLHLDTDSVVAVMLPFFRQQDADGALLAGAARAVALFSAGATPEAPRVARPDLAAGLTAHRLPSNPIPWMLSMVGLVGGGGLLARRWLRRRPRRCAQCGGMRMLLDDLAEDPHLSEGQQAEERVGSVDYDVWWCEGCQDTEIRRHKALLSSRHTCEKCGFVTAKDFTRTLEVATAFSEGRVEVRRRCQHCGHVQVFYRRIPRVSTPRSSSSSFGSSGRASSSFGGGRSSGGGSSGSW
jgi:uncharacterized protein